MQQAQTTKGKRERWYQSKVFKRFRRNPLALVGASILVVYVLIAIFAPVITADRMGRACLRDLGLSRQEAVTELRNPLSGHFWKAIVAPPESCYTIPRAGYSPVPKPPSAKYPLGVSGGGYDILYGVVWGTRTAFYIGVLVTAISLGIGILVGGLAGFFGGRVDTLLMRFTDVIFAFPNLVLAMVIVSVMGRSLTNIMIAIALVGWPTYARILRGDILKTKALDFVDAAHALGAGPMRIFFKHVLPNSIGPLIIVASLDIGAVVLTAAALSFLGLGADVGYADWGQMINFARGWIQGPPGQPFAYWYVSFWPGLVIVLFVLGWNLLGDAVRDALDPRS
ncbi:ABC transporter permease [Marinithermus hydrothermalis]|uniref:ABC-type transporter, integral membrane subunit n=1 Tax=Marinithermus hydrothermalis (strain DSM 14884 / JCM 11576 / T1) TaxID=869210 RepID=F2NNH6_MARHT|nr:ABC transporter permease [Marinithermus hydrothermalis]AEB10786.1 ABC-type transporter, integral membrane subunit [Marinithermus hydrothermalis DSM 14884]